MCRKNDRKRSLLCLSFSALSWHGVSELTFPSWFISWVDDILLQCRVDRTLLLCIRFYLQAIQGLRISFPMVADHKCTRTDRSGWKMIVCWLCWCSILWELWWCWWTGKSRPLFLFPGSAGILTSFIIWYKLMRYHWSYLDFGFRRWNCIPLKNLISSFKAKTIKPDFMMSYIGSYDDLKN